MKAIIYLSILSIFFIASSVCRAQEVTAKVSYDSITKTVFINVINNSDVRMIVFNHMAPHISSEIIFILKNNEQETLYNNIMNIARLTLKGASRSKELYIIPSKSTSVFQLKIAGFLEGLNQEEIKTVKKISLRAELKYFFERQSKEPPRPIVISETFDF